MLDSKLTFKYVLDLENFFFSHPDFSVSPCIPLQYSSFYGEKSGSVCSVVTSSLAFGGY